MTAADGDIATYIAAASAAAAAIAAIGVFVQVRAAHEATLAQLFVAFSERYNAPDMAKALRALANWYRSTTDTRFDDWIAAKRAKEPAALELNAHRRLVSRFYFDVARLHEIRLVSDEFARGVVENNGINVFYKICEPMNVLNHPHKVDRYAGTLKGLCKQYADGSIYESAPTRPPPKPSRWQRIRSWLDRRVTPKSKPKKSP